MFVGIIFIFQHQTYPQEGFKVREQVRQTTEEGNK